MSIRNLRFCIGLIASPEGSKQPLKPKKTVLSQLAPSKFTENNHKY